MLCLCMKNVKHAHDPKKFKFGILKHSIASGNFEKKYKKEPKESAENELKGSTASS